VQIGRYNCPEAHYDTFPPDNTGIVYYLEKIGCTPVKYYRAKRKGSSIKPLPEKNKNIAL